MRGINIADEKAESGRYGRSVVRAVLIGFMCDAQQEEFRV